MLPGTVGFIPHRCIGNRDEGWDWNAIADIGTAVAAMAACFAVAVAIWAAMRQAAMARAQTSLNFVSKLEDDWFSARGQQLRAQAAEDILNGAGKDSKAVYELLLRLERIGLLVETGALDSEVVWSELSSTVLNYYPACRSIITGYQENNRLAWYNLTRLHKRLQRLELDRGGSEADPSYEDWQRHLKGDIDLAAGERESRGESGRTRGTPQR
jgi:hypothetical protein